MSILTDGQINFGIPFEEGYEFPWDKFDGGINYWWIYEICGYKNPVELYDRDGEYLNGMAPSDKDFKLYYYSRKEFFKTHPLPIELINYCYIKYPMYMITVVKPAFNNSRGYPTEFDPKELIVYNNDKEKLIEFCETYCRPVDDSDYVFPEMNPKWYLSSYWG